MGLLLLTFVYRFQLNNINMNIDQHYMPDVEIEKNVYPTPLKSFGETVGKVMEVAYLISGCIVGLVIVAALITNYFPFIITLLNK
jgi:hypothetical protein